MTLSRLPAAFGDLMRGLRGLIHQEQNRRRLEALFPGVHFEWPIQFLVDDSSALTIATGVSIGAFSEIDALKHAPQSPVAGGLPIGAGAGVTIVPGVSIGDDAVIGAGRVVAKSVGPRETWWGEAAHPA